MGYHEAHDPAVLRHYEGLVFSTARRVVAFTEEEFEDIQQVLRLKVFKALLAYDPSRAKRLARDAYVFMCVRDQAKDIAKRRRRGELLIEDIAPAQADGERLPSRDSFEQRYLSAGHDEIYGSIEDDDCLVPNTLTVLERTIVVRLYRDFKQSEIARELGLEKREMERAMRSIRQKLADWQPEAEQQLSLLPEPDAISRAA